MATAKVKDIIQALAAHGMETRVKINISRWPDATDTRDLHDICISKSSGDKFVVLQVSEHNSRRGR